MNRRDLMTFPEFESKCQQWFDKNEHRFMLSDLRIWRTVPGSCEDNDVWYCLVNIRNGVNMILLYDHSGELDEPFEVWVDWARQSLSLPCSQPNAIRPKGNGYTTSVGVYFTIDTALNDMLEEPSPYLLSVLNDGCGIGRMPTEEERKLNYGMMINMEVMSFLECLKQIEELRQTPNCEWKGRQIVIFRHSTMNDILYTTQL